jgi:NAD-dependent dihydropyrimidine dehydrogenase PreA subunit
MAFARWCFFHFAILFRPIMNTRRTDADAVAAVNAFVVREHHLERGDCVSVCPAGIHYRAEENGEMKHFVDRHKDCIGWLFSPSGLAHHGQRMLQPLKNTSVRMPSPS